MVDFKEYYKGKANVGYIVAGYPSLEFSEEFLNRLDESPIDILELGIAYSDPIADGSVISEAASKALSGGATIYKVFELLSRVKTRKILVFLVYYNLILSYGLANFVAHAKKVGIKGLIVPDLPYEENEALFKECKRCHIALIPLISATTSEERMQKILSRGAGFVYAIASIGITGGQQVDKARLESLLSKIKKHTDLPVFTGFGIKTKAGVEQSKKIADGAIVGTSIVKLCEEGNINKTFEAINEIFY